VYSEFVEETETPGEPATDATETDADSTEPEDGEETVHKIVIDPAKQASFDAVEEQVGPGSEETKSGVAESITGTAYETKESELNLAIALLLKQELTDRGYEVVLTREDDNVDITNKARAELANDENADIFVRIQMTESENADLSGTVAFCITPDTPYDSSLYEDGKALATRLLQGVTEENDISNKGIIETDGMTALNWADMPSASISLGFLSNEDDEKNLADEDYRKKLVTGLANGIDYYFK
jgi:N-acetylmuramoyl-L-alanine amidase